MEVAIPGNSRNSGGGCSPFQREVREWQRIDPNTGALLTGRLQADRWINGPLNTYGKLVDSQNVSQPNGTQHTQRKQLEVLQSRTACGAMQVVRAQTVQTTSSRWSSSSGNNSPTTVAVPTASVVSATIKNSCNNVNSGLFNIISTASAANLASSYVTSQQQFSKNGLNDRHRQSPSLMNMTMMSPSSTSSALSNGNSYVTLKELDSYAEEEHSDLTNNFLNHQRHQHQQQQRSLGLKNLLNTAPSLKLSNLMKSSTNVSSSNGNKSCSTTTITTPTITNNIGSGIYSSTKTVSPSAKISLHSLGQYERNEKPSTSLSSAAAKLTVVTSATTQTTQATTSAKTTHMPTSLSNLSHSSSTVISALAVQEPASMVDSGQYHRLRRYDHLPTNLGMETTSTACVGGAVCNDVVDFSTYADDSGDTGDGDGDGINRRSLPPTQQKQQEQQQTQQLHHRRRCIFGLEGFRHQIDDYNNGDDIAREQSSHQLQRGRSVSTDDLSTDWDLNDSNGNEEPTEWRRVSKLRRSFQSTISSGEVVSPLPRNRPVDLPESSVSVSKIRAELENGRRLNTAMRNNHVDLAALDTILNGSKRVNNKTDIKLTSKKTSFLTAESLKEIRGKLKKLSDESLYKDDFVTDQTASVTKDIDNIREIHKSSSSEQSKSAFQSVPKHHAQRENVITQEHTTNSLENRIKCKDTTSTEWHLRRKSYGFEKMSPPNDKTMFRIESSTDSGIGRSSELANWLPVEPVSPATRGTVITFGESTGMTRVPAIVKRRFHSNRSSGIGTGTALDQDELKRHSIAVDESQYVRDNLRKTSVHLNGFYDTANSKRESDHPGSNSSTSAIFNRKRVEFCKTEVHFAAESGRVNIVETDGKPPPTNNFRRRRRTTSGSLVVSSPIEELTLASDNGSDGGNSGLPVIHFGDDHRENDTANVVITQDGDSENNTSNVTISVYPSAVEMNNGIRNSCTFEPSDTDVDESGSGIRGILKNKPIKPKPYHLGENFENPDILWGVQLKPVGMSSIIENQKKNFKENDRLSSCSVDMEPEALSPVASVTSEAAKKSVAERIRIVEERKETTNGGYSTKINLNLSNSPYEWQDLGCSIDGPDKKTKKQIFYDLKMNEENLDDGLKSTSLIIRTMRSANQFDEVMQRLSISSIEAAKMTTASIQIESNEKDRFNEDTSVINLSYPSDGGGNNKHIESIRSSKPIAAPRLKVLTNSNLISHQLSQLRRMYDVAGHDDDSADEEVKGYFPSSNSDSCGTQENSSIDDEKSTEWSGSWSRIKAKKTILLNQTEKDALVKQQHKNIPLTDISKTNIMNIELRSSQVALKKTNIVSVDEQPAPMAKPRNLSIAAKKNQARQSNDDQSKLTTNLIAVTKEPLKIIKETRGARKLREHELSYFGVKTSDNQEKNNDEKLQKQTFSKLQSTVKNPKRMLPHRRVNRVSSNNNENLAQVEKWNLSNDKPDLLRHSSIDKLTKMTTEIYRSNSQSSIDLSDEEDRNKDNNMHIYENLIGKKPASNKIIYSRKDDTERDEMILSEMTEAADQTLKAISEEAALKNRRRRSLPRRSSIPLETIDERCNEKKISNAVVKIARDTLASEARKLSRNSPSLSPISTCRRTSSTSSGENMPTVRSRSRSRSQSNEIHNTTGFEDGKMKSKTRLPQYHKESSRSSSRESLHSHNSSSEDLKHRESNNRLRTTKYKRTATITNPTKSTKLQQRNKEKESQRSLRNGSNEVTTIDTDKVIPRSLTKDRADGQDHRQRHHPQQQQQQRSAGVSRHSGNVHASPKTSSDLECRRSTNNRVSNVEKITIGSSSSSSRLTRNRTDKEATKRSDKSSAHEKLSRSKGPSTQLNVNPENFINSECGTSLSKYRIHSAADRKPGITSLGAGNSSSDTVIKSTLSASGKNRIMKERKCH